MAIHVSASTLNNLVITFALLSLLTAPLPFIIGNHGPITDLIGLFSRIFTLWFLVRFRNDEAVLPFRRWVGVVLIVLFIGSLINTFSSVVGEESASRSMKLLRFWRFFEIAAYGGQLIICRQIREGLRNQDKENTYVFLGVGNTDPLIAPTAT